MKSKQNNSYLFWLVGAIVVVIGAISAYIAFLMFQPLPGEAVPDYLLDEDGITAIEPPLEMPDFTLSDQDNNAISLSDLGGRPTLITFGYTHCPDVCPITLGEMRNIRTDLGDSADSIDYVFISVDGARDSPDVLSTYFATLGVDEFMIGMRGADEQLRTVTAPYGVEYILNEADALGNYSVDHTAGMFLLDSNGNWIRRYRYGIRSQLIADDIQAFLDN